MSIYIIYNLFSQSALHSFPKNKMNILSNTTEKLTHTVNADEAGVAPTINSVVSATSVKVQHAIEDVANAPAAIVDPDVQILAARLGTTAETVARNKRLFSTFDDDEDEETPEQAAKRVARAEEIRRQREAEEAKRAAEIKAINADRASRGLGPMRGAALEGGIQRRAMLRRDAALGRRLDEDMGTSLGYEYVTKAGKTRCEFK